MLCVIILAGGKGTRMGSNGPKVLVTAKGNPLISYVLGAAQPFCSAPIVVVGYKGSEVRRVLGDACMYVEQPEQLGTGNAVLCALPAVPADADTVLVLYGDHPLVSPDTITRLITARVDVGAVLSMATIAVPDFEGDNACFARFSRVVRGDMGRIMRTVEWKDATDAEKEIREVNPAYYCFDAAWLRENISRLDNKNAAGEYYLPDMLRLAIADGKQACLTGRQVASIAIKPEEGRGANTPDELAAVERYL